MAPIAGRAQLAAHIDATWPAVLAVEGYDCREILDPAHADCDREIAPERSTCWSTHAAGRAIDVVVGGEPDLPSVDGAVLGDEIVTIDVLVRGLAVHARRLSGPA